MIILSYHSPCSQSLRTIVDFVGVTIEAFRQLSTSSVSTLYSDIEWVNEWKHLLAEIKNIKLNTNNNIKQYIHHRCYQVTKNVYGNPKSLNSS